MYTAKQGAKMPVSNAVMKGPYPCPNVEPGCPGISRSLTEIPLTASDTQQALARIAAIGRDAMSSQVCVVTLIDCEKRRLKALASSGIPREKELLIESRHQNL